MPAGRASSSVLDALGLSREEEQLYFRLAPVSGHTLAGLARLLGTDKAGLAADAEGLLALGLVQLEGDRLVVPPMAGVMSRLVQRESRLAATAANRLEALADAVPHLVAAGARPDESDLADARPLDGELSRGGNVLEMLGEMLGTTSGEMLWLRPDAWAMEREATVTEMLGRALANGRSSRAIYPVRALTAAPDALRRRARAGEQVRVLSELPTRMFILGEAHAVLPEPLGFADEPRVHVRQRSVVAALTLWFEALWRQATPVPGLDSGEARPDLRRFLLELLMTGATDAVIARTLGVSLRTVRRRIAAMMTELGADTRFQAGVEAVRRGWV